MPVRPQNGETLRSEHKPRHFKLIPVQTQITKHAGHGIIILPDFAKIRRHDALAASNPPPPHDNAHKIHLHGLQHDVAWVAYADY